MSAWAGAGDNLVVCEQLGLFGTSLLMFFFPQMPQDFLIVTFTEQLAIDIFLVDDTSAASPPLNLGQIAYDRQ